MGHTGEGLLLKEFEHKEVEGEATKRRQHKKKGNEQETKRRGVNRTCLRGKQPHRENRVRGSQRNNIKFSSKKDSPNE